HNCASPGTPCVSACHRRCRSKSDKTCASVTPSPHRRNGLQPSQLLADPTALDYLFGSFRDSVQAKGPPSGGPTNSSSVGTNTPSPKCEPHPRHIGPSMGRLSVKVTWNSPAGGASPLP